MELRDYKSELQEEQEVLYSHEMSDEIITTDGSLVWGLSLKLLAYLFIPINPAFKVLPDRCVFCNRMKEPSLQCGECDIQVCVVCANGKRGISCWECAPRDPYNYDYHEFTCFVCVPQVKCSSCQKPKECHYGHNHRQKDCESFL
jgi:hypothetical protein